jgi:hypothetical protein
VRGARKPDSPADPVHPIGFGQALGEPGARRCVNERPDQHGRLHPPVGDERAVPPHSLGPPEPTGRSGENTSFLHQDLFSTSTIMPAAVFGPKDLREIQADAPEKKRHHHNPAEFLGIIRSQ